MKWAHSFVAKYPQGLFVVWAAAVFGRVKSLIISRAISRYLSRGMRQDGKVPAVFGDSVQLIILFGVATANAWLSTDRVRSEPIASFVVAILLCRAFSISVLLLSWIFADNAPIHSYRRSVIGFTLNAVEVALISATVGLWLNCGTDGWSTWDQFAAVVSVESGSPASASLACKTLSAWRFLLSAALVLLVFATLAGGLIRKEVEKDVPATESFAESDQQ